MRVRAIVRPGLPRALPGRLRPGLHEGRCARSRQAAPRSANRRALRLPDAADHRRVCAPPDRPTPPAKQRDWARRAGHVVELDSAPSVPVPPEELPRSSARLPLTRKPRLARSAPCRPAAVRVRSRCASSSQPHAAGRPRCRALVEPTPGDRMTLIASATGKADGAEQRHRQDAPPPTAPDARNRRSPGPPTPVPIPGETGPAAHDRTLRSKWA